MPAVSPCSMALGHRGSMRFSPLTASYPWAQSPAAYTSGSVVAQRPSTRMPRSTAPPASATSCVFGLHMVTAGSYEGESFTVQRDGSYKRLVTADGVLKGVIMVGDVSRAGIYTDLIRKKKPLSEIDFDLIRESPQLMAFSQKDRRVQLGGEV